MGEPDSAPERRTDVGHVRGEVTEAREPEGGPRAWAVLVGTAVAAVAVVAGVFAYQAWQGDDEEQAAPTSAPVTVEPEPDGDADAFLFRRTTPDGIEIRARFSDFGGVVRGGVAIDIAAPVPATTQPVEDTESEGSAGADESEGSEPDGLRRAAPTTTSTAAVVTETLVARPMPVEPGGPVDPDDLPPECQHVGDLMAWAISDETVVQGGGPWAAQAPAELFPSMMWDGMVNPNDPDAETIVGAVLQVPDDVVSVRLTTPTGVGDEMEPVEGAVVLAVRARAQDMQDVMMGPRARQGPGFQITAQRADGSVLTASAAEAMNEPHPLWGPQCQPEMIVREPPPPPTTMALPDAGAEQPADPEAARAEIEHNFDALYGPLDPNVDRAQYMDDNYGFPEVRAAVDQRFPGAAEAATVTIDEIVFTDANNAMFRYTLETPLADFHDQLGRARFLDGIWKITRGTLCQDMSHGGGICGP